MESQIWFMPPVGPRGKPLYICLEVSFRRNRRASRLGLGLVAYLLVTTCPRGGEKQASVPYPQQSQCSVLAKRPTIFRGAELRAVYQTGRPQFSVQSVGSGRTDSSGRIW